MRQQVQIRPQLIRVSKSDYIFFFIKNAIKKIGHNKTKWTTSMNLVDDYRNQRQVKDIIYL